MKIHLTIDQIVLDGIEISRNQRPQMQAALEQEISRLFTLHGIPPSLQNGGHVPRISATLSKENSRAPKEIGRQSAQSIYSQLNPVSVLM